MMVIDIQSVLICHDCDGYQQKLSWFVVLVMDIGKQFVIWCNYSDGSRQTVVLICNDGDGYRQAICPETPWPYFSRKNWHYFAVLNSIGDTDSILRFTNISIYITIEINMVDCRTWQANYPSANFIVSSKSIRQWANLSVWICFASVGSQMNDGSC